MENENTEYGKGTCFKSLQYEKGNVAWCYYMIVKGSIMKCKYNNIWTKPKGVRVQKLKWELQKLELIPIDGFKNKEFYYEDQYGLVANETVEQYIFKDDIYFDRIFDIKKAVKTVSFYKIEDRKVNIKEPKYVNVSLY